MASPSTARPTRVSKPQLSQGSGGETHQTTSDLQNSLTTNHGMPISDDQNTLRTDARGSALLEDFVLREKIGHFDHERIPERIVHARGTGAHGYFQPYQNWSRLTCAAFLQDPKKRTPVFVRFSTVAGGAGSVDLPRDVRGFAVKFYTDEGNFDLVGNNIPVFFIQDALKFPDLIHAVKMEPDRGFPQAGSAHDTFWDFASLMPESMHMLLWAMSDRTIPRSYRMMEGFGVHTFKFVDAKGKFTFVKFHWRPMLGSQSVMWDEAVKINGADNDFHRRDLFDAITAGDFPEWEFSVQAFDEKTAERFAFDVLDATKMIPEEEVPLLPLGKLVLNRYPDNFFAETEQVAFLPTNIVPGIDFSDDPLLQGRLFSYQDTQLIRLGGPNFHQIPINKPRCPMRNFQRDGKMQMEVPVGRVAYEPNSLAANGPRENPSSGFVSRTELTASGKVRERSETFADHYSQARQFFRSMSEPEQAHIINAFAFELGNVETLSIRKRMLGHLQLVDGQLSEHVAGLLGMEGQAERVKPAREPQDLKPSPSLSLLNKFEPTLQGRKIGLLIADGADQSLVDAVHAAATKAKAVVAIIAPKIGGAKGSKGQIAAQHALAAAPSVLFDTVLVVTGKEGARVLMTSPAALNFVRDAFNHCKVIGFSPDAKELVQQTGVMLDDATIELAGPKDVASFIALAKKGRRWLRENTTVRREA